MKRELIYFLIILSFLNTVSASMVPIGLPKQTVAQGETWILGGGYTLTLNSIDARSNPRQVWLTLRDSTSVLQDKVVYAGNTFNYSNDNGLTFTTIVDSIFAGATNDMVQFKNTSISSSILGTETTPSMIPISDAYYNKKTLTVGETWSISGGYGIGIQAIDARSNPRQVWLIITKNCVKVDDKIISQGETYTYSNVFKLYVDSIFAGAINDMVQFKNVYVGDSYDIILSSVLNESWTCGDWGSCNNGNQTRTCTDSNNCGTTFYRPNINQNCIMETFCDEDWQCFNWGSCNNGNQTRTCTDSNNCGTINDIPQLTRNCVLGSNSSCSESWNCISWTSCLNGNQTRTCTDSNNCGTTNSKPSLTKNCVDNKTESNYTNAYINQQKINVENDHQGYSTIKTPISEVKTSLEVIIKESKVYVNTSKGSKQINILPEEAFAKANMINNVNGIIIIDDNGDAVYVVFGTTKAKLLLIFDVIAEIEIKINAENGQILSVKKPWWAFLASGI